MSITFKKYCGKKTADLFRSIGCNVVKLDNTCDPSGRERHNITIHGNRNEFQKTLDKFNTHKELSIGFGADLFIKDFYIENFVNWESEKKNNLNHMWNFDVHNCKIKYLNYSANTNGNFKNCHMEGAYFDICNIGRLSHFIDCDLSYAKFYNCSVDCTIGNGNGHDSITFNRCNMSNTQMELEKDVFGGSVESINFIGSNMERMDIRCCDFSDTKLVVKNCNTNGIKVKGLKVRSLESDKQFRRQFIVEGGIIKDASYGEHIKVRMGFDL